MRKKRFIYLTVSAISAVGMSCERVDKPVQEVVVREVAVESQDKSVRYFEEDFYVTSSGEKLPINAIREGLSEIKVHDDVTRYEFSASDFAVETALKGSFQDGDTISLGQDVAILDDEIYRLPVGHENWNERSLVLSTPE